MMGRATTVLFALVWAAVAGSFSTDGKALLRECQFKAAAHSFELALTKEPGNGFTQRPGVGSLRNGFLRVSGAVGYLAPHR